MAQSSFCTAASAKRQTSWRKEVEAFYADALALAARAKETGIDAALNKASKACTISCQISPSNMSGLRQSHPNLPLILAAAVFVRHLTHVIFVAFKKQYLGAALTCLDFGG